MSIEMTESTVICEIHMLTTYCLLYANPNLHDIRQSKQLNPYVATVEIGIEIVNKDRVVKVRKGGNRNRWNPNSTSSNPETCHGYIWNICFTSQGLHIDMNASILQLLYQQQGAQHSKMPWNVLLIQILNNCKIDILHIYPYLILR